MMEQKEREAFEAWWKGSLGKILVPDGDDDGDATCRIAKTSALQAWVERAAHSNAPEGCVYVKTELLAEYNAMKQERLASTAAAPSASPAAEQREECGMTEGDWNRAEALADMPRLLDARIDAIANAMPGGLDGFLKGWGWRQFARQIEDAVLESASPAALTDEQIDRLQAEVQAAMMDHGLSHTCDMESGERYPLVDKLCSPGDDTIETGKYEVKRLAETVVDVILESGVLAAQPVTTECQKVFGEDCQYAKDIATCLVRCIHCDKDKPNAEPARADRPEKDFLNGWREAIKQLPVSREDSPADRQGECEHDLRAEYEGANGSRAAICAKCQQHVTTRQGVALSEAEITALARQFDNPSKSVVPWFDALGFARAILSRASSSRAEVERDAARCIECGGTGTSDGRDGALIPCLACHSESPSRPAACIPEAWREFVGRVAQQKPEKPDYWSSCSQCEHNISDAEDLLAAAEAPNGE